MLFENQNCQVIINSKWIYFSWQASTSMGLTFYRSMILSLKQLAGYMAVKKHRRFVVQVPVYYFIGIILKLCPPYNIKIFCSGLFEKEKNILIGHSNTHWMRYKNASNHILSVTLQIDAEV